MQKLHVIFLLKCSTNHVEMKSIITVYISIAIFLLATIHGYNWELSKKLNKNLQFCIFFNKYLSHLVHSNRRVFLIYMRSIPVSYLISVQNNYNYLELYRKRIQIYGNVWKLKKFNREIVFALIFDCIFEIKPVKDIEKKNKFLMNECWSKVSLSNVRPFYSTVSSFCD